MRRAQEVLREVFAKFDEDGGGSIDEEELGPQRGRRGQEEQGRAGGARQPPIHYRLSAFQQKAAFRNDPG